MIEQPLDRCYMLKLGAKYDFVNCLSMFKARPEFVQYPMFVHTLSTNRNVVFGDKKIVGQAMDKLWMPLSNICLSILG